MASRVIDINSPRVRELVKKHGTVFIAAMNGMIEASQLPDITTEEQAALMVRGAAAYACGICNTLNISPRKFAEIMVQYENVKIPQAVIGKLGG